MSTAQWLLVVLISDVVSFILGQLAYKFDAEWRRLKALDK